MPFTTSLGFAFGDLRSHAAARGLQPEHSRVKASDLPYPAGSAVRLNLRPDAVNKLAIAAERTWTDPNANWFAEWLVMVRRQYWEMLRANEAIIWLALPPQAMSNAFRFRELAREHGWGQIQVIPNDLAIAMEVLGNSEESSTALIVGIENDGIDLSLVSALKGVVRLRDRDCVRSITRFTVDELLLESMLDAMGLNARASADWNTRWCDVCRLREQLDTSVAAATATNAATWTEDAIAEVTTDDLWGHILPRMEQVTTTAERLLKRNELLATDLSKIILVGGSPLSWRESIRQVAERFPVEIQGVPFRFVAAGAAKWGCMWDDGIFESPEPPLRDQTEQVAMCQHLVPQSPPAIRLTIQRNTSSVPTDARPKDDLDFHRRCTALCDYLREISRTDSSGARTLAAQLAKAAENLLAELPQAFPESSFDNRCPELNAAWQAIDSKRFADAVQLSHFVYEQHSNNPSVFRDMVEIHIEAARQTTARSQSIQWLQCAHAHDPSDKRVHHLLAQQHYEQALVLALAGDILSAEQEVQRSLSFDPLREEVTLLEQSLRNRRSTQTNQSTFQN
jgi:hypothetical protein